MPDVTDYPCPICGEKNYEMGHAEHYDSAKGSPIPRTKSIFFRQSTVKRGFVNRLLGGGTLKIGKARRCLNCDHIALFIGD